jgi:hypothetical protein
MPLKFHCYHQANKCGRQEGRAKSFRFLLYSWPFLTLERSLFEDQIEAFPLFIQWVVFVSTRNFASLNSGCNLNRYSCFLRPKRPPLYLSGFILISFLKGCFCIFSPQYPDPQNSQRGIRLSKTGSAGFLRCQQESL